MFEVILPFSASKYETVAFSASKYETVAFSAMSDDPNNNRGNNLEEDFRYQNITCENLGYTGSGVDVRPYGIAK